MQVKLCAICGNEPASSDDHIPPKSIYPKPRDNRANLNTVPACHQCNNGASQDDEEFKMFIGISTGESRPNTDAIIHSMASTIQNNRRLGYRIFSTKSDIYTQRQGPIYEPAVQIIFNRERVCNVFKRIVRGLYWMEKGCALGLSSKINISTFHEMDARSRKSVKELMDCLDNQMLNNDTFKYKVLFRQDGTSIWEMQFFGVFQTTTFAHVEAPIT